MHARVYYGCMNAVCYLRVRTIATGASLHLQHPASPPHLVSCGIHVYVCNEFLLRVRACYVVLLQCVIWCCVMLRHNIYNAYNIVWVRKRHSARKDMWGTSHVFEISTAFAEAEVVSLPGFVRAHVGVMLGCALARCSSLDCEYHEWIKGNLHFVCLLHKALRRRVHDHWGPNENTTPIRQPTETQSNVRTLTVATTHTHTHAAFRASICTCSDPTPPHRPPTHTHTFGSLCACLQCVCRPPPY